jgi:sugar phosphate isomerase/epimerase
MDKKRREFIRMGGNLAAGLALAPLACKLMPKDDEKTIKDIAKGFETFGLQLYTLRDDMPKDPRGVLRQIASFGYKHIESYEGPQGMFWGMTNTDFKKYMDELGMTIIASHCDMNKDFEKKVADAAAIGMKYLICPWLGPQKNLDDYKRYADEFNKKGEICKKNGIRFAYHNHDYSFKPMAGTIPQDLMMQNTDPGMVDFEMDIYWVATANEDPIAWLKKYKDRFRLCHIKDRTKTPVENNGKNSVDLGTGVIDFARVLKTAKENGMQYFVVEQEAYPNGTPLEAVKAGAEYMRNLKI